jgi:hypothetical protein
VLQIYVFDAAGNQQSRTFRLNNSNSIFVAGGTLSFGVWHSLPSSTPSGSSNSSSSGVVSFGSQNRGLEDQALLFCSIFIQGNTLCNLLGQAVSLYYYLSCLNDIATSGSLASGMSSNVAFADKCQALLNLPQWPLQPLCNSFPFPGVDVPGWSGDNCTARCVFGQASPIDRNICVCGLGFYGPSCQQMLPGGFITTLTPSWVL